MHLQFHVQLASNVYIHASLLPPVLGLWLHGISLLRAKVPYGETGEKRELSLSGVNVPRNFIIFCYYYKKNIVTVSLSKLYS